MIFYSMIARIVLIDMYKIYRWNKKSRIIEAPGFKNCFKKFLGQNKTLIIKWNSNSKILSKNIRNKLISSNFPVKKLMASLLLPRV